MNRPQLDSIPYLVASARELVRGWEQEFINELQPLVHSQSVLLDLGLLSGSTRRDWRH